MTILSVDADIKKASTLPSEFYTSAENFELSKEKIFAKTWQFVGDTDELRIAGSLVPKT
jgi:choline monooxygenase